jgi:hypothetical protein
MSTTTTASTVHAHAFRALALTDESSLKRGGII